MRTRSLALIFAFACLVPISRPASAQVITTVAGGGPIEGNATAVELSAVIGLAIDARGNALMSSDGVVLRWDRATGTLKIIAGGGGSSAGSGDGGPAIGAGLGYFLEGIAVSPGGDLYIAAGPVRRVDAVTGIITTIAGGNDSSYSGDGGPATLAGLNSSDVALDAAGNIYVADVFNERVRRIDAATGIITTIAGNGTSGFSGDGGLGSIAQLNRPYRIAVDPSGNVLIADQDNNRVRRVDTTTGIITTIAGDGTCVFNAGGLAATASPLCQPRFVSVGPTGEIFIGENDAVRRIDPGTGILSTVAGTGTGGFDGDGGLATAAHLGNPTDARRDPSGDLLIVDSANNRLRRVDHATGIIETVAGRSAGAKAGRLATAVRFNSYQMGVSPTGDIYIPSDYRLYRVSGATGLVDVVMGSGQCGFGGDGGLATAAELCGGGPIAFDAQGNAFLGDYSTIRRIDAGTGIVTAFAGSGQAGFSGDGGPATSADLSVYGLAATATGDVYVATGSRIRRIDHATHVISTVAGTGSNGFSGDGGQATGAQINFANGVAIDPDGNLFIADTGNGRVRRVAAATGIITTVAGIGASADLPQRRHRRSTAIGDPVPATTEYIGFVELIAVDAQGHLLLVDDLSRVRRVDRVTNDITTVAGTGENDIPYGDGGPALGAMLFNVGVLAVQGNSIYLTQPAGWHDYRVRRIGDSGIGPLAWTAPSSGGTLTVTVGRVASTAWTAASPDAWLSANPSQASASGSVTVTAGANLTATARIGTVTVAGQTVTVTQLPDVSGLTVDRQALAFAAVSNGSSFTSQTAAQVVRVIQAGAGAAPWTVTSSAAWLLVTPASGAGSSDLSVAVARVAGLPASGTVNGTLTLVSEGTTIATIAIQLTIKTASAAAQPFGTIDTPANNATGVVGAVPFTGWALDDVEVTSVALCRAAVTGETAPLDARCGNTKKIYVGDAVFIDGARPDVEAAYSTYPLRTRAGWGFMVLTNMLPNIPAHTGAGGVGTFTFTFYLKDRDGHTQTLGARTITCANDTSTLPFGTLDTPGQGAMASGAAYNNFGWALTPKPKTIPVDGSTLQVFVDGAPKGHPAYGYARADIQTLFPGLNNTDTGVGVFTLDTTALSNGIHTVSWSVCDDANACTGIGSRFFGVLNGGGAADVSTTTARRNASARGPAQTTIATVRQTTPTLDLASVPADTWAVDGRRGWDPSTPVAPLDVTPEGVTRLRGEELDRLELQLGVGAGETITGYLRANGQLRPLPVGASIDVTTGTFTWAPGVGFIGRYDLVFVRSVNGQPTGRRDVRVTLAPKGSGRVGLQVTLDALPSSVVSGRTLALRGWAADLEAPRGTGVDAVHVWAYPAKGAPVFLGAANYGTARPDVASVQGTQFQASGFSLTLPPLTPGTYTLAVFARRTGIQTFGPAQTMRVTVAR